MPGKSGQGRLALVGCLVGVVLGGCGGGANLRISSNEPETNINLVPLESLDATGTKLTNPSVLDPKTLDDKAIKVSAPGRIPLVFLPIHSSGKWMQLRVKQLSPVVIPTVNDSNRNRSVRLLLKAYQSLYSDDLRVARELANKAGELDPILAAPHIVAGLVALKSGKREEARAQFNKANALDPEDKEISELLKMTAQ